ncbi:MAG: AAC(3) family N-acetyltransferase [Armatimonadetes bacterium]|nr:AAC(3) family N-acetyltransferase [Armatimonadota bacterium]
MIPEVGDPAVRVGRDDIAAAVRAAGIAAGETLLFHSALSSLGTVEGGPEAVIDGLLQAVGPSGTVAVPTLCNWQPGEQHLVFPRWDPAETPSYVGRITEVFRQRPDALRSDHATHSVAAIGAGAAALTAHHGEAGPRLGPFGPRAFAATSPWQRLVDQNAVYAFIGVDFKVATMVHLVESLIVERALARAPEARREHAALEVIGWMTPGVWPQIRIDDREVFQHELATKGLVQSGKIGSATLLWTRAGTMVEHWLALLEAEPARWFPAEYLAWERLLNGEHPA